MSYSDWLLEASSEVGMLEELRQQKVQELKDAVYEAVQRLKEEQLKEFNYAHESAFSADLIKARKER